eukprot:scaffold260785_cov31-Tisochrysis_lutea.AAC.1
MDSRRQGFCRQAHAGGFVQMGSRRRARSDGLSQGVSRRWVPAGVEVGGPEARAGSGERRQVAASAVAEMAWRRECANLRALLWHTSIALANNSSADTHGEEFAPARIASGHLSLLPPNCTRPNYQELIEARYFRASHRASSLTLVVP